MEATIQFEVKLKVGPTLMRVSTQVHETLKDAKAELVQEASENNRRVTEYCVHRVERTQYEAADLGL